MALLSNGKVLVAGGSTATGPQTNAEIYDPAGAAWSLAGQPSVAHYNPSMTVLTNGMALLVGGQSGVNALTNCDLYNPATGIWTAVGGLNTSRVHHTATLLPNGKVLVTGGENESANLGSCEVYDPVTKTWSFTGSLITARTHHTAALLLDGKAFVTGGFDLNLITNSEVYDSATGIWSGSGTISTVRCEASVTPLLNGKLLIAVGWTGPGGGPFVFNTSADIYDPGLGINAASQPIISTVPSPLVNSNSMQITGSRFRGVSQGSDNAGQASPTDFPLLQLRSIEGDHTAFLTPTNWSTNLFVSVPVTNFPFGLAYATVFVNGISSTSSVVLVSASVPDPLSPTLLGDGRMKISFTGQAGRSVTYSVLATTNLSSPWTPAGAAIESLAVAGHFQFTDSQSTNFPNRFYRVCWP